MFAEVEAVTGLNTRAHLLAAKENLLDALRFQLLFERFGDVFSDAGLLIGAHEEAALRHNKGG
jgi:hypothetical protein